MHNKPNLEYRYETVSLLLLNAWELALKAFVRKNTSRAIFLTNGNSIAFSEALRITANVFESRKESSFLSCKKNLELLCEYRNQAAHFYSDNIDPIVFSLIAKGAINYTDFMLQEFHKDVFENQNLTILPLGFKLPFEPEGFLSQQVVQQDGSPLFNAFVNHVVEATNELEELGQKDSVVLGFSIHFNSIKKVSNADIIAAIDNTAGSVRFSQQKTIRVTNDPSAQPVWLSEEEFYTTWPLSYKELADECRKRIPDFKQDERFNKAKERLKGDLRFANSRSLDKAKKNTRWYYSTASVDEIVAMWPKL